MRGNESLIILSWAGNDLYCVLESAVEGIGESDWENRSQKIDIQLQVTLRVESSDY